ncbi:MAG: 2-oxo acid dehydrogenase subunit E2 [Halobacteriovoraceae bacterium]|nr:2-oxo acid dehydrogenase subunit E2 [Halobacteriovoraceae bacterium]
MFKKNIQYEGALASSAWRKIAIGTWKSAKDPSVYGTIELPVEKALEHIQMLNQSSKNKITITHYFGKAMAKSLEEVPELNSVLRWGKLYKRKELSIFFQVATDQNGEDLTGAVVRNINKLSIDEISGSLAPQIKKIRENEEPHFKFLKKVFKHIPGFLSSFLINFTSFLQYKLNLWHPALKSPQDAFGCAMVTNVGSLGLDYGFAPLVPYSHVPLVVSLGKIEDKIILDQNKQIKTIPVMRVGATIDHRHIDGVHGAKLAKRISYFFQHPEEL